jgi:hypothetical protein
MTSRVLHLLLLLLISNLLTNISLGQETRPPSENESVQEAEKDNPSKRAEWMGRGREAPEGQSAAALRLRAHQQKVSFRGRNQMGLAPSTIGWVSLGPAPLESQSGNFFSYGLVTGRATSVAVDPSDLTGNTVYLGGALGGVWKSANAANADPAAVTWTPVTDQQASLATGAVSVKPDGSVLLAGTGEPNNAIDSYYGVGILRSTDKGAHWTLISSADGNAHPFAGLGVNKFAWSTGSSVVAATGTTAKGFDEGNITGQTNRGLYLSTDSGQSWAYQTPKDGNTAISPISVTDVVYNASAGLFFAAIRSHGVYSSSDGSNWTRLGTQPNPSALSTANCPPAVSGNCPMFRGQFSVVPARNEMYFWFIDGNLQDRGIWESTSGGSSWSQVQASSQCTLDQDGSNPPCGMLQPFYNLELSAVPNGSATDLYAGLVNLYKCHVNSGTHSCATIDNNLPNSWINLTQVYSCPTIAMVHPDEHGIDFIKVGSKYILYFANDGGMYRALDGISGLVSGSCGVHNQFDDLNTNMGSMTQFVSFSLDPGNQNVMLGGTQDNGSPVTSTATSSLLWQNANAGDGGYNAISTSNASQWFTANTNVSIQVCNSGAQCTADIFQNNTVVSAGTATIGGDLGPFYSPYILDPQNQNELLLGTCRVWRGSTAGTAFSTLSVNFDVLSNTTCSGNEFNMVRGLAAGGPKQSNFSNVVYATTEGTGPNCTGACGGPTGGEVWVTTNAAAAQMSNVTGSINPLHYTISSVGIDNSIGGGQSAYIGIMGFVGTSNTHIWKTANAGQTWTAFGSVSSGLPDSPVNALLVDGEAGLVYAATDVGVFASSIITPAWTEVGPNAEPGATGYLPNVPVSAIRLFNSGGAKKLRVSTYGRGIWEFDLITTPDYQLAVSNTPLTAFPHQTAVFNGTLTAINAYASPVSLSCGTATPGACSFPLGNPITPADGGAAFNVSMNSGSATVDYNFNVHGVGSDGKSINHDAAVTLQVVDYGLGGPSPSTVTAQQGGTSNTTSFQVTGVGSFAGAVSLSCSGPVITAGATCSFSPSATVHPTAANPVTLSMTVAVPLSVAVNSYTVTIQAASAGAPAIKTQSLTLVVVVPVPDFAIAVTPGAGTLLTGQTVSWSGTLTALNGYNKTVTLACATAGKPGTCTFHPASLVPTSGGAGFTVTLGNPSAGTFDFTMQGTDGTITHATPIEHLVVNTDVAVPATLASASVKAGQTAATSMNLAPVGGGPFSGAVTYACSGLPTGLSCVFAPAQIAQGGTATNVSISISTAGPFSGTQRQPGSENRAPWLPVALPLAAIAMLGVAVGTRSRGRNLPVVGICVALTASTVMLSCGGGGGNSAPAPISVSVSPTAVNNLYPNITGAPPQTQQFTATVHNSSSQGVTWTVVGEKVNGSIDPNGLYTAPGAVPAGAVTVTAVAQVDPGRSANAVVNIKTPTAPFTGTITVTVTEATQPQPHHTATFGLTVQ